MRMAARAGELFSDTGLTRFRIRFVTGRGTAFSEPVSMTTLPGAATGLTASVRGATVDLAWTLPEQPEGETVSELQVHYRPSTMRLGWWVTAKLPVDATSHV